MHTEGTRSNRTVHFLERPNSVPLSVCNNLSRLDGHMILGQKRSILLPGSVSQDSWDDIAVSFEFKKGTNAKDRQDVSCISLLDDAL